MARPDAYDVVAPMLEALRTTRDNIRSLGPAGALPDSYRVWLRVVEDAIAPLQASCPACTPTQTAGRIRIARVRQGKYGNCASCWRQLRRNIQ